MQARGKEDPHKRDGGKDRRLPEYSYDFCFLGDERGYKWTVLVGKERSCGSWMASTVPHKKGEGRFIADKCLEHMSENGDQVGKNIIEGGREGSMA